MSEYQYYEFQALDRPLTGREMSELRSVSSRATITATRFVNHSIYISALDRDAGGRGGLERHRRFGDDPPSRGLQRGVVERLGRLYGTVSR